MGSVYSTKAFSTDGLWGSVAIYIPRDPICDKLNDTEWSKINTTLFQNLDDDDMVNITPIIVSKTSSMEDENGWVVDHGVIRIFYMEWVPELKAYNYMASVIPHGEVKSHNKSYTTDRMHRLAINLEALADYTNMKNGTTDGSTFKRISEELKPYRIKF